MAGCLSSSLKLAQLALVAMRLEDENELMGRGWIRGNGRAWVWCQQSLRERGIGEALHICSMDLGSGGPPQGLMHPVTDNHAVSLKSRDAQNHHGAQELR